MLNLCSIEKNGILLHILFVYFASTEGNGLINPSIFVVLKVILITVK